MLNQNLPQKQSRFRFERLTQITNREADKEVREAMNSGSASAFVVSRLVWRLETGLDTSKGVR
jgi:hypothetical protein